MIFARIALVTLTLLAVQPVPAASCVEHIPAVGLACRVPGGFEVHLADGGTVFTHGGDPAPPFVLPDPETTAMSTPVSCIGDAAIEPHGLAVYVQPSDLPDRFAVMTPDIQDQVETANGVLGAEAAQFGVDVRYRMACDAGRPKVVHVRATTTRSLTTYESIVTDLKALGYAATNQKYWIWLDGSEGLGGFGGFGSIEGSTSSSPGNSNNIGPSYAVTFGYTNARGGWFVMMHESGHNLGAVQNNAFMASGGWHCNDGQDIMCYADGGSKSNYNPNVCPQLHFDCRHDDYFNPRPEPFTYLARSWNLGSPINRWVTGCATRAGRVLPGVTAEVSVAGCDGRPYSVSGHLPPVQDPQNTVPNPLLDVDVCFFSGVVALGCSATLNAPEAGTVPAGATRAVVSVGAAPLADYTFSVK